MTAAVAAAGLPTAGGAIITIGADYLPTSGAFTLSMRSPQFPINSASCSLVGTPASSVPGMAVVRRLDRVVMGYYDVRAMH